MYTHKVQLMRLRTAALLLVFAFPVMVSSAHAQNAPRGLVELEERRRAGFWLAASLGAGREAFDVNDDALGYSSSLTEPTVALRLGGTVNEHLRLGGETIVWFHDVPGGTESLSSVLFVAQYYPLRRGPLFLKAGGGLGRSGVDFRDGVSVSDVGFAVALGGGLEIPVSRRLAIAPIVDWVQQFYSAGREVVGYRERLLHFGVGVVFQTGH
jgi:hypothetical protein